MSSFFSCFQWINWAYDCKLLPSKRYDLFLSWKTKKKKNCLQRHLLTTWIPGILFCAYNLKSKLQVQFIAWCAFFSSFEQKSLDEQYFDAVDLVETAFNKLADNVVSVLFRKQVRFWVKRIPSDSRDGYSCSCVFVRVANFKNFIQLNVKINKHEFCFPLS